ncbi:MAG: hypothetical protein GSR85_11370 [Desulfurococcales archaeon]|nr:hypothetical protein [Desulfurococcales archaeon]
MSSWLILLTILLAVAVSTAVSFIVSVRSSKRLITAVLGTIATFSDAKKLAREYGRKPRRRYIVFEVATTDKVGMDDVEEAIVDAIREVLGSLGLVESGFKLIYYDEARRRGIIRVRHDYKFKILGILGLVREIRGREVNVIPITVTGSLKNAKKRLTS